MVEGAPSDNPVLTNDAGSFHKWVLVFDGHCTPFMNIGSCLYDGGDCCYPYVDDYNRCGLGTDCSCHWTGRRHKTIKEGLYKFKSI